MPTTNINLTNAQAGVINTGSIQEVESLDIRISSIKQAAGEELARAFKELGEAVFNNKEFESEAHKEELLQQINLLAEQAALDVEKRKPGVIRAALSAVAATCASVGGLAAAWSVWGPQIQAFFSI